MLGIYTRIAAVKSIHLLRLRAIAHISLEFTVKYTHERICKFRIQEQGASRLQPARHPEKYLQPRALPGAHGCTVGRADPALEPRLSPSPPWGRGGGERFDIPAEHTEPSAASPHRSHLATSQSDGHRSIVLQRTPHSSPPPPPLTAHFKDGTPALLHLPPTPPYLGVASPRSFGRCTPRGYPEPNRLPQRCTEQRGSTPRSAKPGASR